MRLETERGKKIGNIISRFTSKSLKEESDPLSSYNLKTTEQHRTEEEKVDASKSDIFKAGLRVSSFPKFMVEAFNRRIVANIDSELLSGDPTSPKVV